MITHTTIEGRKATIAYVTDDMEPANPDDATMIKIIFDDGEIRFGVKSAKDRLKSQFASEKRRAQELLGKGQFIRDPETGQFDGSLPGPGHGEGEGSSDDGKGDRDSGGKDEAKDKPSAVKDFKPGMKAAGKKDAARVRDDDWVKNSPVKTYEQATKSALIAQNNFQAVAAPAAKKHGVEFLNPGSKLHEVERDADDNLIRDKDGNPKYKLDEKGNPKIREAGVQRMKDKLAKRPGAPVARVTDLARAGFILNKASDGEKIITELSKTHEMVDEGWDTKPDSFYTDRVVLFRDRETGLVGEIQFSQMDLLHAKENLGGHKIYDKRKDSEIGAINARNAGDYELEKKHLTEFERRNGEMRDLYGKTLDKLDPEWRKLIDGRPKR